MLNVGDRVKLKNIHYPYDGINGTISKIDLDPSRIGYSYGVKLDPTMIAGAPYVILQESQLELISSSTKPNFKVGDKVTLNNQSHQALHGLSGEITGIQLNDYYVEIKSSGYHQGHTVLVHENEITFSIVGSSTNDMKSPIEKLGIEPWIVNTNHGVTSQPVITTLHEAIKFELDNKKPKYSGQAWLWYKEGLCPQCGQKGRYSQCVAICSTHGEY